MANITGEKMHANHLMQAMDEIKRRFDLAIGHFRASKKTGFRCRPL